MKAVKMLRMSCVELQKSVETQLGAGLLSKPAFDALPALHGVSVGQVIAYASGGKCGIGKVACGVDGNGFLAVSIDSGWLTSVPLRDVRRYP